MNADYIIMFLAANAREGFTECLCSDILIKGKICLLKIKTLELLCNLLYYRDNRLQIVTDFQAKICLHLDLIINADNHFIITNSMEQSPWENDSRLVSQKFPSYHGTRSPLQSLKEPTTGSYPESNESIPHPNPLLKSRGSSFGIATSYRLDDWGSGVQFHRIQTGSRAHPASYPMGTRGSFLGSKAAGAWNWTLTPF